MNLRQSGGPTTGDRIADVYNSCQFQLLSYPLFRETQGRKIEKIYPFPNLRISLNKADSSRADPVIPDCQQKNRFFGSDLPAIS